MKRRMQSLQFRELKTPHLAFDDVRLKNWGTLSTMVLQVNVPI